MIDIYKKPLIISGPCSAETREQTIETCVQLSQTGKIDVLRAGIWKPRTKPGSFEGIGEIGLEWLAEVKQLTNMPVSVEVASTKHVEKSLKAGIDMLWIGARTTVNPFIVQEIAESLRGVDIPIMIKNPINPDLGLWIGAVERFAQMGVNKIGAIHRGFSVYGNTKYRNAPLWNIALEFKQLLPEVPVICDPSHITGNRDIIYEISQKSADLNYNGLIIESHICPENAWSDSAQQLTVNQLVGVLNRLIWRESNIDNEDFLFAIEQFRTQIDTIDNDIFSLITKRMQISDKIGLIKRENNVSILQKSRWEDIISDRLQKANKQDLSKELVKSIMELVHLESINRQNKVMNK